MKKLISLVILVTILVSSVAVNATSLDNLKSINAVPESFTEEVFDENITRAEFAYMTARIINGNTQPQKKTRFSDVAENNIYSGYIEYLAMASVLSGVEGDMFYPENPVDINMVNKILVCALGFNSFAQNLGGYPDGYNKVAEKLGLYKNITLKEGYLTKGGAVTLIENLLLSEVPGMEMYQDGGEIYAYPDTSSSKRLLCDVLGYNAYTGEIKSVNYGENTAVITISSNKYAENNVNLQKGTDYVFEAIATVNFASYEKMDVTIWANDDREVINVIPAKGTSVRYAYIDKVNGSADKEMSLPVSGIYSVTIAGDEEKTDVAENLEVKFNNKETTGSVELCGNFARIIEKNDEIIFIESWDLSEGGLITDKTDYLITYTKGEQAGLVIKDALYKKTLRVFIDGKSAGYKDLRVNSVFDYYETNDVLIIVASEKVFTEELKTYSLGNSVEVGNLICMTEDVIYVSEDGKLFKENSGIDKLLGGNVNVYVAPNGYAKYIVGTEESSLSSSFYGIVSGVQSDIFGETAEVELFKIDGATSTKGIYTITEKTRFEAGITIDVLGKNAKDVTGKSLYVFTANAENRITSVEAPKPFYGFDVQAQASVTHMSDITYPYFTIDGIRVYFDPAAPITYIYNQEDTFTVQSVTWSKLKAKNANGSTISFYGAEKDEYPEFILMCGGENGIYDYRTTCGIYTGYKETVNDKGEVCNAARIITSAGAKEYIVSDGVLETLESKTGGAGIITFTPTSLYSAEGSEIMFNSIIAKLYDNVTRWQTASSATATGLHRGIVEKVVGNRIFFEDGKALYMTHTAMNKFAVSVDEYARGERFKSIDAKEILPGDEIYYYFTSGEIYGIILVK